MNVPYSLGGRNMEADLLLQNCIQLGVSGLELRSQPDETFMGAPADLIDGRGADPAVTEGLNKWRGSASMEKARAFRKTYNDAGVLIEIVKFDGIYAFSDEALDYAFELAKALGARAISTEIAEDGPKRVGEFADKHKMMVGYHGHEATGPENWEKVFGYATHNGANLDIGHFVSGNHGSPIPFLQAHHDRITHIHVKDRKANKGAKNRPSESVVSVRLPCGETIVTAAPGTASPCASATRPAIEPVVVSCAATAAAVVKTRSGRIATHRCIGYLQHRDPFRSRSALTSERVLTASFARSGGGNAHTSEARLRLTAKTFACHRRVTHRRSEQ